MINLKFIKVCAYIFSFIVTVWIFENLIPYEVHTKFLNMPIHFKIIISLPLGIIWFIISAYFAEDLIPKIFRNLKK